jgi:citrate synthase
MDRLPAASAAASRLQVLAQQLALAPTASEPHQQQQQQQDDSVRPAPGGGKGTLTIVDNRTGKKYTVRVCRVRLLGGEACRLGRARRTSERGLFCAPAAALPPLPRRPHN